jgi:hypothetical protein
MGGNDLEIIAAIRIEIDRLNAISAIPVQEYVAMAHRGKSATYDIDARQLILV